MTPIQFRDRLDAWGADLMHWPERERAAALRLIAIDTQARATHAQALRMEASIQQSVSIAPDTSYDNAMGARVLSRLAAAPLPAQRHALLSRLWPDALLDRDLAPAWPRVAGLALAGCLGLAIGLFGITITPSDSSVPTAVAGTFVEADLGALVSEPEALTGARP